MAPPSVPSSINLADVQPGQLTVFTEIGKGRFKTVSSGRHSRHGLCAILHYRPDYKHGNRNEARILGILAKGGSTHIPEVYGAHMQSSGLVMAQELSAFGSLRSVLMDSELVCMVTLAHKLHIAAQFANAVSFLESMRVVHTDLACRNVLVFRLEEEPSITKVKLTDFMAALTLPCDQDHVVRKIPQATRWCSPETVALNKWGYKTDVWSLGTALWELFADGQAPWIRLDKRSDVAKQLRELAESLDDSGTSADLRNDFPAPESAELPLAAREAILSCLRPDPLARPSSKQVTDAFKQFSPDPPQPVETKMKSQSLAVRTHEKREKTLPMPTTEKRDKTVPTPTTIAQPSSVQEKIALWEEKREMRGPVPTMEKRDKTVPIPSTIAQPSTGYPERSSLRRRAAQGNDQTKLESQVQQTAWPSKQALTKESLAKAMESKELMAKSDGYMTTPPPISPSRESFTKAVESRTSGGLMLTPPTRCPSTPERQTSPECPSDAVSPGPSSASDSLHRSTGNLGGSFFWPGAPPSADRLSLNMASVNRLRRSLPDTASIDRLSCSLPNMSVQQFSEEVSQKRSNLENLKVFLSSPEAVCSLDPENLISLRRRIHAAAQDNEEPQAVNTMSVSQPKHRVLQTRGPVYATGAPVAQLGGSLSRSGGYAMPQGVRTEPLGRAVSTQSLNRTSTQSLSSSFWRM